MKKLMKLGAAARDKDIQVKRRREATVRHVAEVTHEGEGGAKAGLGAQKVR